MSDEMKWTSIKKEGLPKIEDDYFVTVACVNGDRYVEILTFEYYDDRPDAFWWLYPDTCGTDVFDSRNSEIIAWMPIHYPEPYEEGK